MPPNPSRVIMATIDRSDEFLTNEGCGPSPQEAARLLELWGGAAVPVDDRPAADPGDVLSWPQAA